MRDTVLRSGWVVAISLVALAGCRAGPFGQSGQVVGGEASRDRVDLLAMGDWGTGRAPQERVANALAAYVQSADADIHGMLLAGDNFYVRLSGTDDPQWQTLFEQMYDPQVLDFPFYASLGNHDYEQDKVQIQLDYSRENPRSRWTLPAQ
jgi:tartrate-resistant acid phosphatase type 5